MLLGVLHLYFCLKHWLRITRSTNLLLISWSTGQFLKSTKHTYATWWSAILFLVEALAENNREYNSFLKKPCCLLLQCKSIFKKHEAHLCYRVEYNSGEALVENNRGTCHILRSHVAYILEYNKGLSTKKQWIKQRRDTIYTRDTQSYHEKLIMIHKTI